MRNLRVQLLVSHLLLVLLMVVVMVGAIVNFVTLGGSIHRILKDNYASVVAAQDMKEALERQDSAATFFLNGNATRARQQYDQNKREFERAYQVEAHNITEQGEQQMADDIRDQFQVYSLSMQKLLKSDPPRTKAQMDQYSRYYFASLEPVSNSLKNRAQDVLRINENAINRASDRAESESGRATWTAILATICASVTALFFAVRMISIALMPLRSLARQAEEIGVGHLNQSILLRRSDEIGVLADAFNRMSEKLKAAWLLEEQRLHRAERMSDAALESLYDPVVVTDSRARVIHLNRAAEGLFGPAERNKARPIADVVKDTRIAVAVQRAIDQERVSAHEGEAGMVSVRAGDSERTYRLRVTPMVGDDRELLGAAIVLEDITHLRELDRLKTEFIGVASHELRSPVQSLLLSVQLLEEGAAGTLSSEQQEIVAAQKEDLKRLERTMRDLLDVTRLEAGVIPPRLVIVPIEELLQTAVRSVAGQAEVQRVAVTVEIASDVLAVRADRDQINRVLVNMLDNAIRHTDAGGQVVLEVAQEGADVEICVRDTGRGIPAEHLSRIFERFVQVPGATQSGTGLGLSIARSIVRAHGSDITVESEVGQGSRFAFRLHAALTE